MKQFSLTTAFFASAIFTVCSLGIGACSVKQAKKDNPDIEKNIALSIESRLDKEISLGDKKDWKLASNSWEFPIDHKVEINIVSEKIKVFVGPYNEIQIEAKGQIKESHTSLMNLQVSDKNVTLSQKNDDEVHRVSVTIRIPQNSKAQLNLKTVSGEVEIEGANFQDLSVTTVSGDINAEKTSSENMHLKSVSGDIEIKSSTVKSADLFSVSGDVKLKLSNADKVKYDLQSLSGDIEQIAKGSPQSDAGLVRVQTTSGDIEIQ